jgi:hypothetical protein
MNSRSRFTSPGPSSEATLVYTVGLNGYAERYSNYVRSQQLYADHNQYLYVAITEPSGKYGASEASWLKIAVMNDALALGYDRVAYIDCDAEVLPSAPPLDNIFDVDPPGRIFMARGHSGRFNSGVMFVRNSLISRRFYKEVWNAMGTLLDPADDVGWGDNGHVIQVAKKLDCVTEIPTAWNSTVWPPPAVEFVRHHTGPLQDAETQRRTSGSGTIAGQAGPQKPAAGHLTTSLEHSALLVDRARLLATEYWPPVPAPHRGTCT